LSSVQLIPSWQFFQLSSRKLSLPLSEVMLWHFSPWRLIEFFSPGFFMTPADYMHSVPVFKALGYPTSTPYPFSESVFIGGATIILAIGGLKKSRLTILLGFSGLVVLWFASGYHFGAKFLLDIIPVINKLRYGEKYLTTFLLCVSLLAAFGTDRLASDQKLVRRTIIAAAILAVILISTRLYLTSDTAVKHFQLLVEGEAIRSHLINGLIHTIIEISALAIVLLFAFYGKRTRAIYCSSAIIWISLTSASGYALRPGHPSARINVEPIRLSAPPPGPRIINIVEPHFRLPRPGWNVIDQYCFDMASGLYPNTNAVHRIDNLKVDTGVLPLRFDTLFSMMGENIKAALPRYSTSHFVFPSPRTDRGKNLREQLTAGCEYIGTDPKSTLEIWQVPHREWASFPRQVEVVKDIDQAIEGLKLTTAMGNREWGTAFVETEARLAASPGRVISVNRNLEQVEIVAETGAEATIVINDAYWPGWRAWIDGAETQIYPADALVRAVCWPAGRHTLLMKYKPQEVQYGIWLSITGLVVLVISCMMLRLRQLRVAQNSFSSSDKAS
jgi:hypothetical protein